jgi:flagellar basal-body rod modification protein FlgD
MSISPITAATTAATTATTKAEQSNTKLAETFDTFLGLLTAQLKNQDPLDPLDSAQFTEQLVMFASAEQSIAGNKNLETLIDLFHSGNASSSVNYLGKTISASGSEAVLSNGAASWQYELDANSAQTTITIENSNGNTVFTGPGLISKGSHEFQWDGKDNQGLPQPDGLYSITITAKDINGQSVATTTTIEGIVTGVESLDDGAVLSVGGVKIPVDKVVAVKQSEQPTQAPVGP